jgi:hypothetical protein
MFEPWTRELAPIARAGPRPADTARVAYGAEAEGDDAVRAPAADGPVRSNRLDDQPWADEELR